MAIRFTTSHGVSLGLSFSSTSVPKAARMLARRLRRDSGDWGEISLIQLLDAEAGTRFAAAPPAFSELLQFSIVCWNVDLDSHQLVAPLAVLRGKAAPLEAKHPAGRSAPGDREHHCSLGRRHFHLGAERCFLERDRQVEADVGSVAGVETVWRDLDRDDRVAATARPLLTLAGQADARPILEALRELHVDRLAVGQRDPLRLLRHCVFEWHFEAVGDVGPFLSSLLALPETAEWSAAAASSRRGAEQAFEEVAEVS